MKMKKTTLPLLLCLAAVLFAACCRGDAVVSVSGTCFEVTAALAAAPDAATQAIVDEYRQRVIDIQAPVLGYAPVAIERGRPEGMLNNFEADALRESGSAVLGKPVDVAVANYGGIRNSWPQGDITVGDVNRAFPFENCLFLMTLTGSQLMQLFAAIAHSYGHPISGAHLVIDADGNLITADVQGRPVDYAATYTVATLDYLAEGNDGLDVLREGQDRRCLDEMTMRQIVTDRIMALTAAGKPIESPLDGRIEIIE